MAHKQNMDDMTSMFEGLSTNRNTQTQTPLMSVESPIEDIFDNLRISKN